MLIQIVSFVATILVIIVAGVKLGDTIKDLKMKIFFLDFVWSIYINFYSSSNLLLHILRI